MEARSSFSEAKSQSRSERNDAQTVIFFVWRRAAFLLPYGKKRTRIRKNPLPYGTRLQVYGTGSLPYDTRLQAYDAGSPYTSNLWGTGDLEAIKGQQRGYSYTVLLRKCPEIRV